MDANLQDGEALVKEGDLDDTLYILTKGTIKSADFEKLLETHPKQGYNFMRGMFRVLHLNLLRMNAETRQLVSYISKTGGRY